MKSLTLIGAVLFFIGLFAFSLKLMAYNRKKYQDNIHGQQVETEKRGYPYGLNMIRILAIIVFLLALIILALFRD